MSATTVELSQLIDKIAPNSTVLDLRGYGLEALPENIGDLTYLTKLNLNGNRLTSLPESISNLTNLTELYLNGHKLATLPESIGNLTNLTRLDLNGGFLRSLPDNIAKLINLTKLKLSNNQFNRIPDILLYLPKLQKINLDDNPLTNLSNLKYISKLNICRSNSPSKSKISRILGDVTIVIGDRYLESIWADLDSFTNINLLGLLSFNYGSLRVYTDDDSTRLVLQETIDYFFSFLSKLPKLTEFNWNAEIYPQLLGTIASSKNSWVPHTYISVDYKYCSFSNYCELNIVGDRIQYLPESLSGLRRLTSIRLGLNPLTDLSILNKLPNLSHVAFHNATLPRRYWTKLSEWKPEWLLDENNTEIRRRIIDRVGYEKICEVLNTQEVDTWREYVLLKIDNFEPILLEGQWWKPIGKEPIVLLKMTCPSTGHIHILRVPPDMTSAEDAIVWVNHGIHPDRFTIQT